MRQGWGGSVWQGRFSSFPLDARSLLAASRSVALHPVRAPLVARAEDEAWCSARAQGMGQEDGLVHVAPWLELVRDWPAFLARGQAQRFDAVRMHERTGRPRGGEDFAQKMSPVVGRDLTRKKPGRKRTKKYVLCPFISAYTSIP